MAPRRETPPYRRALGEAIRKRRKRLGLSQEGFGEEARIDRTYMSGLERGTRNPTLETILRIADCLGASPSELLAEAEASMGKHRS